jgi:hypothetical protein
MSDRQPAALARLVVVALTAAVVATAYAGQHPQTNELSKDFAKTNITTIAALPFASDIGDDEDPDKISASMSESKFYQALNLASGFTMMPAAEVGRVLEEQKQSDAMKKFYKHWINDQEEIDENFIKNVAHLLKTDAVVAGAVDVWHQAPVDITQSGTARTSVGALVGLFDGATGKLLWIGRDENFQEALRYTPNDPSTSLGHNQQRGEMERTNLRTAGGVYAPPDFPPVVDLVVNSLVGAFPKRAK